MQDNTNPQAGDQYEYDGQCAFAVSTGKLGVAGSPEHIVEAPGRTYTFSNGVARLLWRILPGRAAKADLVWRGAESRA